MFAHPYVASLIARERERGMLNAPARHRLARQPTTRGAAMTPSWPCGIKRSRRRWRTQMETRGIRTETGER